MTQVVELLPNKSESLSFKPQYRQKINKKSLVRTFMM
jgi:hypothetical protein